MTLDAVARALAAHHPTEIPALPGRTNHLRAGVLVPLRWHRDRVEAVLTLRSADLRRHAGEVSWPGGRREPQDVDLVATAVREAREEIGARVRRILGPLSSMPLFADGVEVARLLPVDVRALLHAPAIEGLPFEWDGTVHLSPIWDVGGAVVYGGTAHVLHELLRVLAPAWGVPLPPVVRSERTWGELFTARTPA